MGLDRVIKPAPPKEPGLYPRGRTPRRDPARRAEVLGKEHLVYGVDRESGVWARLTDSCPEAVPAACRAHA
jgi:hypothetical protein